MEHFLNIDWNPSLDDIIDNVFLNDERLEREAVMHKILRGSFKDPLANLDEDYIDVVTDNISEDLLKQCKMKDEQQKASRREASKNNAMQEMNGKKLLNKPYIPGLTKVPFKFSRLSTLNKAQQALCLRVLLRFSSSVKPEMTPAHKEELDIYMQLKNKIDQEQDEYLEEIKNKWNGNNFPVICEDYINLKWRLKRQNILKLPRYYTEVVTVPFLGDQNIVLKPVCTCYRVGQLPRIALPNLDTKFAIRATSDSLEERFPVITHCPSYYTLPVSQDDKCEIFANKYDVDLVISSSGLNCLMNNVGTDYSNVWLLPVVVKQKNDKNIVYIDKRLPPSADTILTKNTWVYKYIVRKFLIHPKCQRFIKTYKNDNIFDNLNSNEIVKLEQEHMGGAFDTTNLITERSEEAANSPNSISMRTDSSQEFNSEFSAFEDEIPKSHKFEPPQTNSMGQSRSFNDDSNGRNASYTIFNLEPQSTAKQENSLKNSSKREFKILVRTKTDGVEKLKNGHSSCLMLAPKLEHQTALGAESVTLEEAMKQWTALTFRPNTSLARVRVSVLTDEIIQIERRTTQSINNEIKRLYNVKVENSFNLLYNMVQTLTNLAPGKYIVRHTLSNGAFATVYKETNSAGKNIFDLHAASMVNDYYTIPNFPWPPVDKAVIMPSHIFLQKMPAMFNPGRSPLPIKMLQKTKKGRKKV